MLPTVLFRHNADVKKCFNKFKKSLVQAHLMKCKVTFLTMCLDNSFTPKCLIPMKYRQHNLKPISDVAVKVLSNEIRSLKIKIEKQFKSVRFYKYDLKNSLEYSNVPVQHFKELLDSFYSTCRFESNKALFRHTQKFEKIFVQSP